MVYHTVYCSLMIFNWCFICQKQFFQISQIITHGARANKWWVDQEKGHKMCFAFFLLVNGYVYCAMVRVGLVLFFFLPDVLIFCNKLFRMWRVKGSISLPFSVGFNTPLCGWNILKWLKTQNNQLINQSKNVKNHGVYNYFFRKVLHHLFIDH